MTDFSIPPTGDTTADSHYIYDHIHSVTRDGETSTYPAKRYDFTEVVVKEVRLPAIKVNRYVIDADVIAPMYIHLGDEQVAHKMAKHINGHCVDFTDPSSRLSKHNLTKLCVEYVVHRIWPIISPSTILSNARSLKAALSEEMFGYYVELIDFMDEHRYKPAILREFSDRFHNGVLTVAEHLQTLDDANKVLDLSFAYLFNENAPEWQPDKPKKQYVDYKAYLQSDHWKKTRVIALERANHHCQVCNSTDRLNVHHRTYERLGSEDPEDLTVLCESCHKLFHDNGRLAK